MMSNTTLQIIAGLALLDIIIFTSMAVVPTDTSFEESPVVLSTDNWRYVVPENNEICDLTIANGGDCGLREPFVIAAAAEG